MKKSSDKSGKKTNKKNSKKSWDTSSKIIFAVIALVVVAVIVFVVARGRKEVIVDKDGQTHIVVTDFWGNFVQDEYGNLFEKVTDSQGNDVTKGYIFPDRVVNKKGNKIENAFINLKLPKDWADFCTTDLIAMQHEGACMDENRPQCEVKIRYDIMADPEALYATEKGLARGYTEKIDGFDNFKEYETTIFGLEARAMSYTSGHGEGTYYYYIVEQGLALFEIRAYACNDCYDEAALIEEIEKSYKLKNLGGERPEIPSTEAPTEEFSEENTTESSTSETSTTSAK